jgi:hypothetical protein
MRTHNLLIGIIATFFTFAHGSGYTAPAYTLKANNQSMLLGYQLYGSHIYNASAVCRDITVASHGIWNQVETWMVQRKLLPLCRFSYHEPRIMDQKETIKLISPRRSLLRPAQ